MIIRNTEKSASDNSLLIFLTDTDGEILCSTDEHSGLYESSRENYNDRHAEAETSSANPYLTSGDMPGWMIGASRYLSLPGNYSSYLSELLASEAARHFYVISE